MKKAIQLLGALALALGLTLLVPGMTSAQTCDGTGTHFVDLNGDGINDNAPDADGDGIPNGLDPDWLKNPQDGTGYQHRNGAAQVSQKTGVSSSATAEQQRTMTMNWFRAMFHHQVRLTESCDGDGLRSSFGAGPHSGETRGNGSNSQGQGGQGNGR